jgi:hypothetical protein
MKDSAQLVVASILFLLGVGVGAITFHPDTSMDVVVIPLGTIIALAVILAFIGMANLVVEGLKK